MFDSLFAPRGVVVVGATRDESKLGFAVARNLVESGYPGAIHFVNPHGGRILDRPCHTSLAEVPDPVDLAAIIVPAETVPGCLEDCGRRGVKAAVVLSGGFGEIGEHGKRLEDECVEIARRHGMRLLGPNCVGILDTRLPLNTTFIKSQPQAGDIAFVSQSGAICQAVIDWGTGRGFGFSRVVSLGNQADVSEAEIAAGLAGDPHTAVITMYLEGVRRGRPFLEALSRVTRRKPVVALKVGRTRRGRQAVASHTGAMAGDEAAYDAAFARCGVLRASSAEELFDWARALAWCPPWPAARQNGSAGPGRVAVLTNAGGPGVMAVDALEAAGLRLANLSPGTRAALRQFALTHAILENPVDLLASAGPPDYAAALRALLADPAVDAVLVISVPPPIGDPGPVAEAIARIAQRAAKPVVVTVMGEATVANALRVLREARIPDYRFPERAASALAALYRQALRQSRAVTDEPEAFEDVNPEAVSELLSLAEGEFVGDPMATEILVEYGIHGARETLAGSEDEAASRAEHMGYPVALKVAAPEIVHKSDAGGVALGLKDSVAVRQAYRQVIDSTRRVWPLPRAPRVAVQEMVPAAQEVIVGAVRDEQFGPLVMFGAGGIEVEGTRDVAFGLAPLSRAEAEAMVDSTCAGRRLRGYRSIPPADREAAVEALMRVAQFAADFPQVAEVEINPLCVRSEGCGAVAVDTRIRLRRYG